ncbi:MAG: hypothetical protein OXG58_05445 [Gemmatimonadetes bacterium]|nr:hypothetical protein [Gemmatimonadota bacterium]MCY3942928.1 hypothetical protein [Gemmatimonadota bacterium]
MTRKPADEVLIPRWGTAALYVVAVAVLFGEFVFSDEMPHGEDTVVLGYMARAFFVERIAGGDFPLWVVAPAMWPRLGRPVARTRSRLASAP